MNMNRGTNITEISSFHAGLDFVLLFYLFHSFNPSFIIYQSHQSNLSFNTFLSYYCQFGLFRSLLFLLWDSSFSTLVGYCQIYYRECFFRNCLGIYDVFPKSLIQPVCTTTLLWWVCVYNTKDLLVTILISAKIARFYVATEVFRSMQNIIKKNRYIIQ